MICLVDHEKMGRKRHAPIALRQDINLDINLYATMLNAKAARRIVSEPQPHIVIEAKKQ
ncbi:hypothetical protein FACS189487_03000 [Campylobacterota bacterium]|nr:hypothetical protein FACS189487_03000 [Campylobacterota bacterium]